MEPGRTRSLLVWSDNLSIIGAFMCAGFDTCPLISSAVKRKYKNDLWLNSVFYLPCCRWCCVVDDWFCGILRTIYVYVRLMWWYRATICVVVGEVFVACCLLYMLLVSVMVVHCFKCGIFQIERYFVHLLFSFKFERYDVSLCYSHVYISWLFLLFRL